MTAISAKEKKIIMQAFEYFEDGIVLDDMSYIVVHDEEYKKIMAAKRVLKRVFKNKGKGVK